MGNSCLNAVGLGGREFVPSEGVTGQDEVAYEILLKIISKKQVDKMWSCYCEIDADQSGSIRDDEFRAFFKLEKGAFNQKLFGCFDADHSGYLNFFEFTCALWNFLSTDPYDLGGFVFYLFDDDRSGSLDFQEIRKIIEIVHAQDLNKSGRLSDKINEEMMNKPPYLTIDDFQKWTRAKPMLTNPVLNMQLKLQGDLLGPKFWKEVTQQRSDDEEKVRPGYVFREIARADAIYALREKQRLASKNIDKMKGSVKDRAAASRPADEKTQRRNSMLLGMMNLKAAATPKKKQKEAKFDSEKYRDKNDIKFDDKRSRSSDLKATTMSAVIDQDEDVYVNSLDVDSTAGEQSKKKKPITPKGGSGKKGRSTIAVVGGTDNPRVKGGGRDSPRSKERSHRATTISPKNGASPLLGDQKERSHRSTVISPKNSTDSSEKRSSSKKSRSTIVGSPLGGKGALPPLKTSKKAVP